MKKHESIFKIFALILFVAFNFSLKGQVGINNTGTEPNASAMLDVSSTNKGLLIPRMTRQQRQSISNPANGLLVFETDNATMGFYYFNGNIWQKLEIAGSDWGLNGNSGTNSGNFIGTTDAVDLNFKVNNKTVLSLTQKGQLETKGTGFSVFLGKDAGEHDDLSDNYNVFVGESAGYSNTTGHKNVALGYKTLYSNTISNYNTAFGSEALYLTKLNGYNTAVGYRALYHNKVTKNTAIGYKSLYSNTTGYYNSAFGTEALSDNTMGPGNTACGYRALTFNTTGSENSSFGTLALENNRTGNGNTAVGSYALSVNNGNYNTAIGYVSARYNHTGSWNTAVGNYSLYKNKSGQHNTAVGNYSLLRNQYGSSLVAVGDSALPNNGDGSDSTLGLYNTAVGAQSFVSNITGNYNTALGYKTDVLSSGLNYATALGAKAHVAASNALVLGGTGDAYVKVGIGTSTPENLLDVVSPASSDAKIRVLSDTAHKSSLKLFESGNYGFEFQYNGNNDKLNLWSRNFSGNEGIRMTWLKNGKVGIGTDIPDEKLDVRGNFQIKQTSVAVVANIESSTAGATLQLKANGSNLSQVVFYDNGAYGAAIGYDNDDDHIFFYHGTNIFIDNGNFLPGTHKGGDLGANGQAWDDIYYDDLHNQGAAAFTDRKVTEEIINFPPIAKIPGSFDYKTKRGNIELNALSLPKDLHDENSILTDEVVTYNYKANYEQQLQINELKKIIEEQNKKIEQLMMLLSGK